MKLKKKLIILKKIKTDKKGNRARFLRGMGPGFLREMGPGFFSL